MGQWIRAILRWITHVHGAALRLALSLWMGAEGFPLASALLI